MQRIPIVQIEMVKDSSLTVYCKKVTTSKAMVEVFKVYLSGVDREHLILATLNTKNIITSLTTVSIGSLNSAIVHPREVFKTAILANADTIILAHNHPSGDPNPSKEDIDTTNRIKECGKLLGIELLDHIILGDSTYVSLKEKGVL